MKSKWAWIGGGLFLAVCVGFILLNRAALRLAQEEIQKKLSVSLPDCEFRIGKLSTNFATRIAVPLAISNPGGFQNGSFLEVEEIHVRFRFWKLARFVSSQIFSRDKISIENLKSSFSLTLQKPSLLIRRKENRWNVPILKKGDRPFLSFLLTVQEGKITVEDDRKKWDSFQISNLTGQFQMDPAQPELNVLAETPDKEKIQIQGHMDSSQKFNLQFQAENIQAANLLKPFLDPESRLRVQGKTKFSGDLTIPWSASERPPIKMISGNGTWNSAEITVSPENGSPISGSLNGHFSLENGQIKADHFDLKTDSSQIRISGLWDISESSQIQVKGQGSLDLNEISSAFSPSYPAEGKADWNLEISGSGEKPVLTTSLTVSDGTLLKLPFQSSLRIFYPSGPRGQISSLSGLWGKGVLTGKANFSDARNLWNLSLKNFRLEDIFSSSPFSMAGQTTISVSGSGNRKDPTVRAKLNVSGFSLDREKMGSLSGSLFKNSQNFNLSVLS
ncbi:MAG: hypothetical protein HY610_02740, partial [Elusimicrobia bacterium]|nr:hypothetical protein [Elusimicrobiota bacterium]